MNNKEAMDNAIEAVDDCLEPLGIPYILIMGEPGTGNTRIASVQDGEKTIEILKSTVKALEKA